MIESLHNADTSITSKPTLMNPQAAVLICNYIDTAFIAVFFYDYILNIPAEVELIWSHIRSRGSLWYLIVRYFTFSGFVMISIPNFVDLSHASCHVFNILRQILMVINAVLISVIFTMRTYALYDRCKRLLACLLFVMLSLFATVCWALGSQHGSIPNSEEILVSLEGCHVPTSRAEAWRMIVAWGCLLAFDTLLFLLTAARAIRRSQLPFRLKRYSSYTHLVVTIYRDVAIYYFVMVAFNTATLICFFLESDMFRAVMVTPTSVVSAILCARLILNIREATSVIFWTQPAYYTPPICLSTNFDPGLSPH